MSKMKAVIKPDQGYGFELTQVPVPVIGLNDVLIKVKAASICGSDLPIYEWNDPWVQSAVQPGTIIGHEFCGTIVEIGGEVSNLAIGDFRRRVKTSRPRFKASASNCFEKEDNSYFNLASAVTSDVFSLIFVKMSRVASTPSAPTFFPFSTILSVASVIFSEP